MNLISPQIRRLNIALLIIFLLFLTLLFRAGYLVTDQREFLLLENQKRVVRQEEVMPTRGMILDRNGLPLAVSKRTYTVSIDPQTAKLSAEHQAMIVEHLNIDPLVIQEALISQKHYRVLAKQVSVKIN